MSSEENNSIKARGKRVLLECDSQMRSLVARLEGVLMENKYSTDKLEPEMMGIFGGLD